ncbi:MAG: phosphoribosylformylglycinamidine cyclo-ligase [Desulfobacterales bacterium]|nr:phosphoribosylformylglycinamidine cyclo-ligase [Desulfobacterales bacterium]
MSKSLTYADAGVNIDKANDFVGMIKNIVKKTPRTGVIGDIGGFGGLYSLNTNMYQRPVLVSSTDGVGTKLKIAFMMDKHDTVGIDLVAMCVNDIAVQGAKPLFFLDYLAVGKLETTKALDIVNGIAEGCCRANCALIGGETAEMPDMYAPGEYDLAGFTVGIVDNDKIVDGSEISVGHSLLGIGSSGLHSNGFSLVRKICFEVLKMKVDDHVPEFGKTLGEELLTPTRIYSETIRSLIRDIPVHGLAHITGGGIVDNLVRVIPDACDAVIHPKSWEIPPVFQFLKQAGNISDEEMFRTFNNGIGIIAVVPEKAVDDIIPRLKAMNETCYLIGEIVERKQNNPRIQWT